MLGIGGAIGCEQPRRMPYVPPDLHNWKDARPTVRGLRLHLFTTTGSVDPPAGLFGGSWATRVALEVPAFVIEHPRAGAILVGTGLSPALREQPERHLGWLLARVARPSVEEGDDLRSQLEAAGFAPARIRRVILPDCRFPQTGGLSAFGDAEVLAGRADREWGLRSGLGSGVQREDLLTVQRWQPVDFAAGKPLGTLARAVDLLSDGSVWLLDVAGYTPGSMAVLVRLPKGPVVLAGGAVPLASTLRTPVLPPVATDGDGWWEAAWRLKRLRELAEILVVPGFDLSAVDDKPRPDVVLHRVATRNAGGEGARDDKDEGQGGGMKGRRDKRKNGGDKRSPMDQPVQPRPNPSFPLPDPPATPPPMQR
jgi:glyoxylase-like metal-dependent hydrolase (beta-lactamase superfamily II)